MSFYRTILIVLAVAIVLTIFGVYVIQNLSYSSPELPQKNISSYSMKWSDVYNVVPVSSYRYEVIIISDDELNSSEVIYVKDDSADYVNITFAVLEGVNKVDRKSGIIIDKSTYRCVQKYYNGTNISCDFDYGDYQSRLAAYALPNLREAKDKFETLGVESALYKGRVYDAVKFVSSDGSLVVWVVEDIPLPVRFEITKNDGSKVIANLKFFELYRNDEKK